MASVRYYLIPFDPAPPPGIVALPMYVHELGLCETVVSLSKQYYLVKCESDYCDFAALESHPEVVPINRANTNSLAALGIDTSKIRGNTPRGEIERRIMLWLTGEDREILADARPPRPGEIAEDI